MKLIINKSKTNYILLNLITVGIFFLLYNLTGNLNMKVITVIGIIQYIWMFMSWYKITGDLINIYLLFLMLSFGFYLGQPILYLMNLPITNIMSITTSPFTLKQVNSTIIFLLKSMALFHLGAFFAVDNKMSYEKVSTNKKALRYVGVLLFVISVIPQISFAYESIMTTVTIGYANIFKSSFVQGAGLDGGLPRLLSGFFNSSLLLLILGNINNKKRRNFWFNFSLIFMLIMIASGQRGSNTLFLITLFLLKHYTFEPFTKRQIIKYSWILLFGLTLLSLISSVRNMALSNLSLEQILTIFANNNLITNLFAEMGFTLLACTTVMVYSPALIPFNVGATYVNSILALIPNLFWEVHPAAIGGVDQLFKGYLLDNSGIGSSLFIEAYYNFGQYSLFFVPFFGFLFGKMYYGILNATKKQDYLKLFIWLSLIPTFLWFVRSETLNFWRTYGYYTLLPVLLITFYNLFIGRKEVIKIK